MTANMINLITTALNSFLHPILGFMFILPFLFDFGLVMHIDIVRVHLTITCHNLSSLLTRKPAWASRSRYVNFGEPTLF